MKLLWFFYEVALQGKKNAEEGKFLFQRSEVYDVSLHSLFFFFLMKTRNVDK